MLFGSLSTTQDFGFRPPSLSSLYTLVGWLEDEKKIVPPISLLRKKKERKNDLLSSSLRLRLQVGRGKKGLAAFQFSPLCRCALAFFDWKKTRGGKMPQKLLNVQDSPLFICSFFTNFAKLIVAYIIHLKVLWGTFRHGWKFLLDWLVAPIYFPLSIDNRNPHYCLRNKENRKILSAIHFVCIYFLALTSLEKRCKNVL